MKSVAKILLISIVIASLSACAIQTYSVQLNPVGNPAPNIAGNLRVLTPTDRCPDSRNPHDGCMVFKKNKIGLITFHLPGSKKMNSTCASPGTNRVITSVELSTRGEGGIPTASKGDFGAAGLVDIATLRNDAFRNLNTSNGEVYTTADVTQGNTQVILVNNNSNDYVAGSYVPFWYRVTVTDCNDDTITWVSDPRGDNEGTKY